MDPSLFSRAGLVLRNTECLLFLQCSVGAAAGQSHAFAAVLELHRRTLLRELPELARDESIIAEVEADEVTKLV
ncbi:hypothetical protein VCV18_004988 [Metarhizium anisopliae]